MTFGLTQCDRKGLDRARVFGNQFLLTMQQRDWMEGGREEALFDYTLYLGPKVPAASITLSQRSDVRLVVLGMAIDRDGVLIDQSNLQELTRSFTTLMQLEDYISLCAGRYVVFMGKEDDLRAYPDPNATMGLVYNTETGDIAASTNLALRSRITRNEDYLFGVSAGLRENGRFSFGHTADPRVKRVGANHYLSLKTLHSHRFWPRQDATFEAGSRKESEHHLTTYIDRHQAVIKALADGPAPLSLGLTAGADSRVLLACAKPCHNQIAQFFTSVMNLSSSYDAEVGALLAQACGVAHEIHDFRGVEQQHMDDETYRVEAATYNLSVGLLPRARAPSRAELLIARAHKPGTVVLRGHVTDILKGVMWDEAATRGNGVLQSVEGETRFAMKMMHLAGDKKNFAQYRGNKEVTAAFTDWANKLPAGCWPRLYDFSAIEQFRPYTIGGLFYSYLDNFLVPVGNDRQAMAAAISLNPLERVNGDWSRALHERLAPELADIPYLREYRDNLRASEK